MKFVHIWTWTTLFWNITCWVWDAKCPFSVLKPFVWESSNIALCCCFSFIIGRRVREDNLTLTYQGNTRVCKIKNIVRYRGSTVWLTMVSLFLILCNSIWIFSRLSSLLMIRTNQCHKYLFDSTEKIFFFFFFEMWFLKKRWRIIWVLLRWANYIRPN